MIKKQLNKEKTNANMYFNLFADKIGKFNNDESILLIHIGNFDVISKFIVNNVNCNYFIIDKHLNGDYLKLNFPQIHFFGSNEDESIIEILEQIDMKFDKIIMNPPYDKNLHLQILAKATEHLTDDGELICLHPYVWENQIIFEGKLSVPITSYEIINAKEFRNIFNLRREVDGSITFIKNSKTTTKINSLYITLMNKILKYKNFQSVVKFSTKEPQTKFTIRVMFGGSPEYGSTCLSTAKFETACQQTLCTNIRFINFNSINEQKNFFNTFSESIFLKFITYKLAKRNLLPWMGDCINPRTGLKGYAGEWTNEDFYTYFNITKEEQELIEKTMEKYK